MKAILVPIDFSEYSEKALKVAAPLAKKTGAKMILLHCIYTDSRWESMAETEKQNYPETLAKIDLAERQLKQLVASSLIKGIQITYTIAFGAPYTEIVNHATRKKVDLIIIGSHGNEGSDRFYIGSNIQKVLRRATCPVLTIKKDAPIKGWKKLVFATNLSDKINKPFIQISKIATALNLTIHLVVVNRPNDFMTTRTVNKKMDVFIKQHPSLKFTKSLYCHTSIEDGILEYAEDINADWIAMCTHTNESKPGYLIGNTEALVYRTKLPLMSVRM